VNLLNGNELVLLDSLDNGDDSDLEDDNEPIAEGYLREDVVAVEDTQPVRQHIPSHSNNIMETAVNSFNDDDSPSLSPPSSSLSTTTTTTTTTTP